MRSGRLRHYIQLQRPAVTVNDAGETVVDNPPTQSLPAWADVQPLQSREIERARQAQMQTTHRVIIRYRSDVQPGWTIKWGDVDLMVTGIIPIDGRTEALELTCQQVTQP